MLKRNYSALKTQDVAFENGDAFRTHSSAIGEEERDEVREERLAHLNNTIKKIICDDMYISGGGLVQ